MKSLLLLAIVGFMVLVFFIIPTFGIPHIMDPR